MPPPARHRDLPGAGPREQAHAFVAGLLGPPLPGAACAGLAPLHDDRVPGEDDEQREARHHQARTLCARCPALLRCTAELPHLQPHDHGIWAGTLRTTPPRARPSRTRTITT